MLWSHRIKPFATRSLRWQLGISYALLVLIVTALLTGLALRTGSNIVLTAVERQALAAVTGAATAFSEALARPVTDMSQVARQQSLATDGRVLWLNVDGTVRLDAYGQADLGGTRLDLPYELIHANEPVAGVYSTPNGWATYAAAPVTAAHRSAGLVVLTQDISHTQHDLAQLRVTLWLLGSTLACGFAALGLLYSQSVTRPLRQLTTAAQQMQAGNLAQRVLPQGSDELRQLASDFNAMANSVAALDEQRRTFVANAAHELRTPLAALQALAYEMQEDTTTASPDLEAFVRQTKRLGRTVDNLLTLARLDNPDIEARMIPIRVHNLLAEVLWVMRPVAAKHPLELIFPVELEDEPWILGDPDWLQLALVNILENSIRYSPPHGWARVEVGSSNSSVVISITDSGPGVPQSSLPELGQRFFRVSSAREHSSGGSGLGLAIVREIVLLHGGRLAFDSPSRQGLAITITFAAIPEPEDEL